MTSEPAGVEGLMEPELNKVYVGDSTVLMDTWMLDRTAVIVTDPVWPNAKVPLYGSNDPFEALRRCAESWPRLARAAIVHLGCDSDPRILAAVPSALPFVRIAWLRYARPHYKGNLLYGADVAYLFGDGGVPERRRVLPGEATSTDSRPERNGHPCPRKLQHLQFLIGSWTKSTDIIIDPFAGSGTTLVAAEQCGRDWLGIEIIPEFAAIAERRIAKEKMQMKMAI